jgi:hypothetical protein
MVAFVPHTTSGATVTLNVDGLGAKPLRYGPNLELRSGVRIQGTPYVASYIATTMRTGRSICRAGLPIRMACRSAASAPNSAFALPRTSRLWFRQYVRVSSRAGHWSGRQLGRKDPWQYWRF